MTLFLLLCVSLVLGGMAAGLWHSQTVRRLWLQMTRKPAPCPALPAVQRVMVENSGSFRDGLPPPGVWLVDPPAPRPRTAPGAGNARA